MGILTEVFCKLGDSRLHDHKLSRGQVYDWYIHTNTHMPGHSDVVNDNTRRPKLGSGKNLKNIGTLIT